MYDEIADYLDLMLESIDLIESRFFKIGVADEFVESSNGITYLDAISMRLQVEYSFKSGNNFPDYPPLCFEPSNEPADLRLSASTCHLRRPACHRLFYELPAISDDPASVMPISIYTTQTRF